jgi:hypothetical protein
MSRHLAIASVLPLLVVPLLACHDEPQHSAPSATATASAAARVPETHVVVQADHRNVIRMTVGDRIALPTDPELDWRAEFEDKNAFRPVAEGGASTATFAIEKTGPLRVMVYGDPKCAKRDGGCGLSKRRWDVTLDVR